jgi:diguanylate cyclase (GGDEF)-like protein
MYLDSRLAKGVFTDDDVDILTAINNQITASMVTAQAAQLAATLQAAERRSELADTMRTSMAEVSQTLDPDQVESRLLATLVRAIGADAGAVLHDDGTCLGTDTIDSDAVIEPAVLKLIDTVDVPRVGVDTSLASLYPDARSWLALPLNSRARRVGLLLLISTADTGYDDAQLRIAAALAEQGMVAYDNAQLYRQVEQLAGTDPLTGLHNRRQFFKLSAELFTTAVTTGQPLAAVMVDIDHFKQVNDTHGHGAGDDVIGEVAARLRGILRGSDLLGRYGGEEFALILPGQIAADSAGLGERLRQTIDAAPIATRSGPLNITISIGTTQLHDADRTLDDALARADAALYRAKQNGRNQVVTEA